MRDKHNCGPTIILPQQQANKDRLKFLLHQTEIFAHFIKDGALATGKSAPVGYATRLFGQSLKFIFFAGDRRKGPLPKGAERPKQRKMRKF